MINSFHSGCDRKLFKLSSWMSSPFQFIYGLLAYRLWQPIDPDQFDNCSNKFQEIAVRILIILAFLALGFGIYLFPFASLSSLLSLFLLGKLFRIMGFYLQKKWLHPCPRKSPRKILKSKSNYNHELEYCRDFGRDVKRSCRC